MTEQTLSENFDRMIHGVQISDTLTDAEKQYITELLSDQRDIEVQTAIMLSEYKG